MPLKTLALAITITAAAGNAYSQAQKVRAIELEEVIVTAERRKNSLQDTPIAVTVFNDSALEARGINSIDALNTAVPSLQIKPFGNTPSTLVMTIRGNGQFDTGQLTRESSVATYVDGIYLGRAQGLNFEFADIERVEVLRGPQGTLYGRNATGGAINLITKSPTGELGFVQTLGMGRFDEFRSETHINLPEFNGIRVKADYTHSERDGWVDNPAAGQADFNEYSKDSGQVNIVWAANSTLELSYRYDYSEIDAGMNYFQLYRDSGGVIGAERDREKTARAPVQPLDPTATKTDGHSLVVSWQANENVAVKSLTAYRELDEETSANYAGIFYSNGLLYTEDIDQEQVSQEFQILGSAANLEWMAGLFYYAEDVASEQQNFFTLDSGGCLSGGVPNSPVPPTTVFTACLPSGPVSFPPTPPTSVEAEAESTAVYGQLTWTPPVLQDRLQASLGIRYTEDEKSGDRTQGAIFNPFDFDTDSTDYSLTLNYGWIDGLSTYAKWSTAYKAGGVSVRSAVFEPYDNEEVETFEIGLKSEFWGNRARFNAAVFYTDYDDMHIDFIPPGNLTVLETVNARKTAEVDGIEFDLTVVPVEGLIINLSYTYLDGDMPLQPNPLAGAGDTPTLFDLILTPQHAGALSVNYTFQPWQRMKLSAHLDVTSTDQYAYASFNPQRFDAYTLFNARLTLADIKLGDNKGSLKFSVWGKNLTDEEYIVFAAPVDIPVPVVMQAYGDPRTAGVDITYEF